MLRDGRFNTRLFAPSLWFSESLYPAFFIGVLFFAVLTAIEGGMMDGMEEFSPDMHYMRMALREAEQAAAEGEVPCGAVIVLNDEVIGKAHNQTETLKDPTAHAEVLAITQATQAVGNWRLKEAVMYVTKEPCPMCAGALVLARVSKVVWGMTDPVRGGALSRFNILNDADLNHRVEMEAGLMEEECRHVMQHFFQTLRQESKARKQSNDSDSSLTNED